MSTVSSAFLLNSEIVAAVSAFAKNRKVSPRACLEAAAIALAMQPFEMGQDDDLKSLEAAITPAKQENGATPSQPPAPAAPRAAKPRSGPARAPSDQSLKFRDAVLAKVDTLKGQRHTFAEIAKKFDIDAPNAVNNLKWLQKQKKIDYKVVGYAVKDAGQKGRAPALIEFV